MDENEFDLSQYFDLSQFTKQPAQPALPDVELPEDVKWATEKYDKKTPANLRQNDVLAYRITAISHKDLPKISNAVLTFYDTLGSEHTVWKTKRNGKHNSAYEHYRKVATFDGRVEGDWVLLRQLIPYKAFNAYRIVALFDVATQAEQLAQYKRILWDPFAGEAYDNDPNHDYFGMYQDDWGDR
jgi:hypothetical protein